LEIPDSVLIESLGNRVGGIARPADSPAVFVRGALPGEQVTIRNQRNKKNFVEAELASVEKPSPHRVEPFCRYYGVCGGCSLQHLEYSEQLVWKKKWVEKAVRNLSVPALDDTVPSPETRGYRNRVTFDVSDGRLTLHAFRGNPVPVDLCPLMNEASLNALNAFVKGGIPDGITRISVRGGSNTDTAIVELTGAFQSKPPASWPAVVIRRKKSWQHLKPGEMFEKIGEFTYAVQPGGFFQVNTRGAEKLVAAVTDLVPENSGRVLDLYGGTGTFGVPLAAAGNQVTSVEMDREASEGCRAACELNQIPSDRIHVVKAKAGPFLKTAIRNTTSFSTIITDPPRSGMGIEISQQIRDLNPERIIYVSCNPFTAARDIAIFTQQHYTIRQVAPVDMFPHTDHVETVFFMERN
jgi:23S rRNA (uracil1939-C5)-methyltransferase